jgi:hypothetical protein
MQREPSAKENKHQQQSQKQNHGTPHVSVERWEHYPRPACLTRYLPSRRLRPLLEWLSRPQPAALEHRSRTLEMVDSPRSVGRCTAETKQRRQLRGRKYGSMHGNHYQHQDALTEPCD